MAAIITNQYRIHNAKQFIEAFDEADETNIYLFIGRPQEWEEEHSPDTPEDTIESSYRVWDDMIALKKITASDVSHVIPRRNWTTGKFYDMYRSDYDGSADQGVDIDTGSATTRNSLFDANFVVITDDYNVYKCLNNRGTTNVVIASTVKPTGTSTSPFTTADGYIWKYMYTVSPADVLKFITSDFIPVRTQTESISIGEPYYDQFQVQEDAIDGGIESALVTAGGTGYVSVPTVTIEGDGTGATATATISGGAVKRVLITDPGEGYTFATATIGAPGTGATVKLMISPKGGHGSDAISEIGGFFVVSNVRLENDEGSGDFPASNDFRRIGLIKDPFNFGTTTLSTASTLKATKQLTLEAGVTGDFELDEIIEGEDSEATAIVVSWDSDTRILRYAQTTEENKVAFDDGETITGATSAAEGVIDALGNPEVEPYSGDLIYLENRRPISRAEDQTENITIVVEF